MSYAFFDHAGWVERNVKYELSELWKTAANIIRYVGGGIYNCPINIRKIDWSDKYCISINWRHGMSNWDNMMLSKLWVLCARKKVRVTIEPCNMQYIRILFHQRSKRCGCLSERLPDCEELIKIIDEDFTI